jgi:hypothetical protein
MVVSEVIKCLTNVYFRSEGQKTLVTIGHVLSEIIFSSLFS